MRLCLPQNFFGGTGGHQLLQDKTATRIANTGVQLAVGKGSGTAFSELHIGVGIQDARLTESRDRFGAALHRLAALDQQRAQTGSCQHQCGEQPGRAASDHDGPMRGCSRDGGECQRRRKVGFDRRMMTGGENFRFAFQRHDHGNFKYQMRLFTCIDRTAVKPTGAQSTFGHAQAGGRLTAQVVFGIG